MRITFDYLSIDRFKGVREPLHLPLGSRGPGLYFIRGRNLAEPEIDPNGAGKSTLLQALCWCLFGRTINGLRNPDIAPWAGGNAAVEAGVTVDDSEYQIRRTTEPNRLTVNDEIVSQEAIEQLLGIGLPVLAHTLAFGQGEPLFFDLAPRDKLALFTEVLQLDRWEARATAAGAAAAGLLQRRDQLNGESRAGQAELARIEEAIASAQQLEQAWDEEQRQSRALAVHAMQKAQAEVTEQQKWHAAATLAYDGAMTELTPLEDEITQVTASLRTVEQNHAGFVAEVAQMERGLARLDQEIRTAQTTTTCPTCGQKVTRKDLAGHLKRTQAARTETVKRIEAGVPPAIDKLMAKYRKQLETLGGARLGLRARADEASETLQRVATPLARAEAEVARLRQVLASANDLNPHRIHVIAARKRKTAIEGGLRQYAVEIATLEKQEARARYWIKGFKDVRLFLIEEVLSELEMAANAMLPEVGLSDWHITFNAERETQAGTTVRGLATIITGPGTPPQGVRWESWSGGEGQRLRLVGALALSEVLLRHAGIDCPLLWLDEPTRGLSPTGVRDLLDSLAQRAATHAQQIWCVDHIAREGALFTDTVTIVKDRAGVRLDGAGLSP